MEIVERHTESTFRLLNKSYWSVSGWDQIHAVALKDPTCGAEG